jgi:sulfite reductase (NADPH) hemoprotein beta-component
LADPITGAIADDDTQLIKFHGSYQQDDRDLREERRAAEARTAYSFMIRTRLPGGVSVRAVARARCDRD